MRLAQEVINAKESNENLLRQIEEQKSYFDTQVSLMSDEVQSLQVVIESMQSEVKHSSGERELREANLVLAT